MGHRRWSNSRHIPLSCSENHAALGLSGIPSVSQTHLLHNHGWHKATQHGLTARITLAKLRSVHAAAIQSPRTMAIRLRIIAILLHTSVSRVIHLGPALTDLSKQSQKFLSENVSTREAEENSPGLERGLKSLLLLHLYLGKCTRNLLFVECLFDVCTIFGFSR